MYSKTSTKPKPWTLKTTYATLLSILFYIDLETPKETLNFRA